jgi:hypothetical protein
LVADGCGPLSILVRSVMYPPDFQPGPRSTCWRNICVEESRGLPKRWFVLLGRRHGRSVGTDVERAVS